MDSGSGDVQYEEHESAAKAATKKEAATAPQLGAEALQRFARALRAALAVNNARAEKAEAAALDATAAANAAEAAASRARTENDALNALVAALRAEVSKAQADATAKRQENTVLETKLGELQMVMDERENVSDYKIAALQIRSGHAGNEGAVHERARALSLRARVQRAGGFRSVQCLSVRSGFSPLQDVRRRVGLRARWKGARAGHVPPQTMGRHSGAPVDRSGSGGI